jgi:hypothetical protein
VAKALDKDIGMDHQRFPGRAERDEFACSSFCRRLLERQQVMLTSQ